MSLVKRLWLLLLLLEEKKRGKGGNADLPNDVTFLEDHPTIYGQLFIAADINFKVLKKL